MANAIITLHDRPDSPIIRSFVAGDADATGIEQEAAAIFAEFGDTASIVISRNNAEETN